MLTVHCASSLDELAPEREQLDAINSESRLPDLFSTFEFYQVYFQHDEFYRHGVETELWFLTIRDEGRIIGYLPLRKVRERVLGLPIQVSEEARARIAAAVAELARLGVVAEGPQALARSMPFGVKREQPDRQELAATP
jgi:hypothetical protein